MEQSIIQKQDVRIDHLLISEMVKANSRVIDIGCGDGALLRLLADTKGADARGIEISPEGVSQCMAQGLSVIQGDANRDLVDYPDRSFDYAILSETIQAVQNPRHVIEQLLRIADRAIVSFPNFGHWYVRMELLLNGRMPVTDNMPNEWYETPNIHLCTIRDFEDLCAHVDARVEEVVALNSKGRRLAIKLPIAVQNLIGKQAVFVLARK